ncbi:Sushi, von Willebrand factor type A, EGF and pentraxin [Branchiostoma belcheri]|nr:Sushi, von Willebrand factor type A, EGF and pentraxin [Branchiostoma belcheri]
MTSNLFRYRKGLRATQVCLLLGRDTDSPLSVATHLLDIPNSVQYPLGDGRHGWKVVIRQVSAADHSGRLQCEERPGKTEYINLHIIASCSGRFRTPVHGSCQASPDCDVLYEGDTAVYGCYPGYVLVGQRVHTCTANGWDAEPIQCVPELTFQLQHGLRPHVDGDVIEVYTGADLVLDCTLTSDGNLRIPELSWGWQPGNSQASSSNHSGKEEETTQIREHIPTRQNYNLMAEYFVDDGNQKRLFLRSISKQHAGNYTCQAGSPDHQGAAVEVRVLNSCSRLLPPQNGTVTSWSHTVGSQVTYSCHEQYRLVGNSTRQCQATGEWTGEQPTCQVYRCSEVSAPAHGGMTPTSFLLGTEVSFWCENGYNLSSDADLVCKDDGTWSSNVPDCISHCENHACGKGEKCVLDDGTPTCVCKTTADCSVGPGPVCGSDAESYGNECQMEVTSCSTGQDIGVVHTGFCEKAGLCYDTPVAVPDDDLTQCTHQYYMDNDKASCELVPAGLCMTGPQGFDSQDQCDAACDASVVCSLPTAVPGNCSLGLARWTYHPDSGECLPFVYTGCGGNENNFLSRDQCLQTCPVRCPTCETVMQLNTACRFSTLLGSHALKTKVLEVAADESWVTLSVEESLHLPISELPAGNLIVPVMSSQGPCGCHPPRLLPLDSSYLIIFTYQLLVVDETTYVEVWDSEVEQQLNSLTNCVDMKSNPGTEVVETHMKFTPGQNDTCRRDFLVWTGVWQLQVLLSHENASPVLGTSAALKMNVNLTLPVVLFLLFCLNTFRSTNSGKMAASSTVEGEFRPLLESVCKDFGRPWPLKPLQEKAVTYFVQRRKDIFACLPTGYGKTELYTLVPLVMERLLGKHCVMLVVSPLLSLMQDQVQRLQQGGIKAAYVGETQEDADIKRGVIEGKYSLVFVSPEAILNSKSWRGMLTNKTYREHLVGVAVDEAHCITSWYGVESSGRITSDWQN